MRQIELTKGACSICLEFDFSSNVKELMKSVELFLNTNAVEAANAYNLCMKHNLYRLMGGWGEKKSTDMPADSFIASH